MKKTQLFVVASMVLALAASVANAAPSESGEMSVASASPVAGGVMTPAISSQRSAGSGTRRTKSTPRSGKKLIELLKDAREISLTNACVARELAEFDKLGMSRQPDLYGADIPTVDQQGLVYSAKTKTLAGTPTSQCTENEEPVLGDPSMDAYNEGEQVSDAVCAAVHQWVISARRALSRIAKNAPKDGEGRYRWGVTIGRVPQTTIGESYCRPVLEAVAQKKDTKGEKGDKGDTGEKGEKGDTGAMGLQGPAGRDGKDAGSNGKFRISVAGEVQITRPENLPPMGLCFGAEWRPLENKKNLFGFDLCPKIMVERYHTGDTGIGLGLEAFYDREIGDSGFFLHFALGGYDFQSGSDLNATLSGMGFADLGLGMRIGHFFWLVNGGAGVAYDLRPQEGAVHSFEAAPVPGAHVGAKIGALVF